MAEASYIVLRKYVPEDLPSMPSNAEADELWNPVATVTASSGDQAIKKVSEPEGTEPIPGDYWAIAARYSQARERVKSDTIVKTTREKLPPPLGANVPLRRRSRETEPVEA
jgi:hypothetical protein